MQILTAVHAPEVDWEVVSDDVVMGSLVAALVLLLVFLAANGQNMALQAQSVFAPQGSRKVVDCARTQNTALARVSTWAMTLVMAVDLAALSVYFVHKLAGMAAGAWTFGLGVCCWTLLLFVKRWFAGFVNWTFFEAEAVRCCQCVYRLSMAVGVVCWTAVALVVACNGLPLALTSVLCILALFSGLAVTIWGTWRLFFGKMLGCLHFLLYLCTLELLPFALAAVEVGSL